MYLSQYIRFISYQLLSKRSIYSQQDYIVIQFTMGSKSSKVTKKIQTITTNNQKKGRLAKFKQEAVFEDDNRKQLPEALTLGFIGLIRAKFKSKQTAIIGTGVILQDDLVLTVAHNICLINRKKFKKYINNKFSTTEDIYSTYESNDSSKSVTENLSLEIDHAQYPQWIEFYPGLNGTIKGFSNLDEVLSNKNRDQNYYKVKQFKVHPLFITQAKNRLYDICLLHLSRKIELKQSIKVVSDYTNDKAQVSIYGYPRDQSFKQEKQNLKILQIGTTGRFKLDTQTGYLQYQLATESGQSGSPIFINTVNNGKEDKFCIGIHAGCKNQLQVNYGIHINEEKFNFICQAEEKLTSQFSRLRKTVFPRLPITNIPKPPPKNIQQKSLQDYLGYIFKTQLQKLPQMPKQFIYYLKQIALIYLNTCNYQKAIEYYDKFLREMQTLNEASKDEEDEEQYETGIINLAKCLCQNGDYEKSLITYQKSLSIMEHNCTQSIEKYSTIYNNKGAVLVKISQQEQALEYFRKAYNMRRSKFGEENVMTYSSFENIASIKYRLSIDLQQCCKDFERIIKFKQKKYGVGSIPYLMSKMNLALVIFELKRYRESIEIFYLCQTKIIELTKDNQQKNINFYQTQIRNNFTIKLQSMSKLQCSLNDLKYAAEVAEHFSMLEVSKQLKIEWEKRISMQSN